MERTRALATHRGSEAGQLGRGSDFNPYLEDEPQFQLWEQARQAALRA
jgi:hypothetical protein